MKRDTEDARKGLAGHTGAAAAADEVQHAVRTEPEEARPGSSRHTDSRDSPVVNIPAEEEAAAHRAERGGAAVGRNGGWGAEGTE